MTQCSGPNPPRDQIRGVLDLALSEPLSPLVEANPLRGIMVGQAVVRWYGSSTGSVGTRVIAEAHMRHKSVAELWAALAKAGLIPKTWLTGDLRVVSTEYCPSCDDIVVAGAQPCRQCDGTGEIRKMVDAPCDLAQALTLAVDVPTVLTVQQLIRQMQPAVLSNIPIAWHCADYEEHCNRVEQYRAERSENETERAFDARSQIHALGVTLGAPDERTMMWTEVAIPTIGQAPSEQSLEEPATMPPPAEAQTEDSKAVKITREYVASSNAGKHQNISQDPTNPGVFDKLRSWITRVSKRD